ncbi:hypothetical protein BBJ28_00026793, partial [Nothophytophthora sp. Chile5]
MILMRSFSLLVLLLALLAASVAARAAPPPRAAVVAREQVPQDDADFEKREVENCVPYDIRSSVVGARAVVEWATRRTYIRKVRLQKAHDTSPVLDKPWRSCHDVAADMEVRYRQLGDNGTIAAVSGEEEPFTRQTAITYTTDEATFTTHTAFLDLPSTAGRDSAYEFIVGSVYHGWSAVHQLGANMPFRGDQAERCRPKHVHTAYGSQPGSFAVQWMTTERCGDGSPQIQIAEGYHVPIVVEGPDATPVAAWANTTLFEDDGAKHSKRWQHVARLDGLKPDTRYTYVVGNALYGSWSIPYATKTAPAPVEPGQTPQPTRFLVTGDIGYQNAATLPMMQSEVAEGVVDGVVSVGDY